jgi:hypothetical protein
MLPSVFLPPDFFANSFEEHVELVVSQAVLLDLRAKGSQQFIGSKLAIQPLFQRLHDKFGHWLTLEPGASLAAQAIDRW